MITQNNWIAVTPFPEVGIKTKRMGGLALMEHTIELQKLTVMFEAVDEHGNTFVQPGDVIYLKADAMKHQWSSEIYTTAKGNKYIVIPRNLIIAVEYSETTTV